MPSPIAHTAVAYLIYRAARLDRSGKEKGKKQWPVGPFLLIVGLSVLPDLDFLPGLLTGNLDVFHNTVTHSLFSGLVVALLGSIVLQRLWAGSLVRWFAIVLVSYELHVVMDYFTFGRGVMVLWPFSTMRYEPPFLLFYGLHRSDGLLTIKHLWTILSEGVFAIAVILVTNRVAARSSSNSILQSTARSESTISSD